MLFFDAIPIRENRPPQRQAPLVPLLQDQPPRSSRLCGGLDLGQSLALLEAALLLQSHNLKSVEVGESTSSRRLEALLGPVGLGPLAVDLSLGPRLLDGTGSRTTGKVGDDDRREQAVGEGDRLSGDSELGV